MITHHGATNGVTGSCHQLHWTKHRSILIDCGLFQGAETAPDKSRFDQLQVNFPVNDIDALVVTHVHIDHVGRIPYLLAAGFNGIIYCSEPSAYLLPLVLEDALKIGFTRNAQLISKFLGKIKRQIVPMPYKKWQMVGEEGNAQLRIKLQPAGHILGSAYVECELRADEYKQRITFSGDLGAPFSPLLGSPLPPYRSDILVLESTYGDKCHENRSNRRDHLRKVIQTAILNQGIILIPAFSIGRTQELLYELEQLIHQQQTNLEVIVDSPLASRFTDIFRKLHKYWDKEAQRKLKQGRHPLAFDQLLTINDHKTHLQTVKYLKQTAKPTIVIAASGMCSGGRIVNYLKALIEDQRTDILFVGYQAKGTPGRAIQQYGPLNGWVEIEHKRYVIHAKVHTIGGYSAHADQQNLINFVKRIRHKPKEIRLVHGDIEAKTALQKKLQKDFLSIDVWQP